MPVFVPLSDKGQYVAYLGYCTYGGTTTTFKSTLYPASVLANATVAKIIDVYRSKVVWLLLQLCIQLSVDDANLIRVCWRLVKACFSLPVIHTSAKGFQLMAGVATSSRTSSFDGDQRRIRSPASALASLGRSTRRTKTFPP